MPELGINPEKVCAFIELAREVAGLEVSTTGESLQSGDDSPLATMIEPPARADPRRHEMVTFIGGLDAGEQVNLLALILLGRGDYGIEEWQDALIAARDAIDGRSADFLIGNSMLPGYLLAGLEAFNESCD